MNPDRLDGNHVLPGFFLASSGYSEPVDARNGCNEVGRGLCPPRSRRESNGGIHSDLLHHP